MQNEQYVFTIDNNSYQVSLRDQGWHGPINSYYFMHFDCNEESSNKKFSITIRATNLVTSMWGFQGRGEIAEMLNLSLQCLPSFLSTYNKNPKKSLVFTFHRDDNVQKIKGVNYIKADNTLIETARKQKFTKNIPTNNEIRREIIMVCYSHWQTDPHGFVDKGKLLKLIPVTEVELERNIRYLEQGGFIDANATSAGYSVLRITNHGVDTFENLDEFNKVFELKVEQRTLNVGGDYIAPMIVGSGNKVLIKSQIDNSIKDIEIEIKNSDIKNKPKVVKQLKDFGKELKKKNPNSSKVKKLLNELTKAGNWINKKILSHPIIAQIIAEILLKSSKP